MSKKEYSNFRKKHIKKSKVVIENDIIWSAFNYQTQIIVKSGIDVYSNLSRLHFAMAHFLREEGKDFNQQLKVSQKYKLLDLRNVLMKLEVSNPRIEIHSKNCCEKCDKINGKKLTINEAIKNQILPFGDCTNRLNNFCTCIYLPVLN